MSHLAQSRFSFFGSQQWMIPPGRTRNIFSSENITFFQRDAGHRRNVLANVNRLATAAPDKSGFRMARRRIMPVSASSLCTVQRLGRHGTCTGTGKQLTTPGTQYLPVSRSGHPTLSCAEPQPIYCNPKMDYSMPSAPNPFCSALISSVVSPLVAQPPWMSVH